MDNVNCFAYCGVGSCSATNNQRCVKLKNRDCVFCKTAEEYALGCKKSAERIVSLGYSKCRPIFEKYCLFNEHVVPEFKEAMKLGMKDMMV